MKNEYSMPELFRAVRRDKSLQASAIGTAASMLVIFSLLVVALILNG